MPRSPWITGALPSRAAARSVTTGSSEYCTSTNSTASTASALVRAAITATISPTWFTVSVGTGRCTGDFISGVIGQAQARPPCSGKSRPVHTPTTPGAFRAAVVSIDVIVACASGERTMARCTIPGSTMLSVNVL